jgi:hypothetical protein
MSMTRTLVGRGLWVSAALLALALHVPSAGAQTCAGDCNTNNEVTVNEVVILVNIDLGSAQLTSCPSGDIDGNTMITIDEVVSSVKNLLEGCPTGPALCGNHTREEDEECDDGGFCLGGTNAGTACVSDGECAGEGVCVDGAKAYWACNDDTDCGSGSTCVRCRPAGGDGCSANCTLESPVEVTLVPGMADENMVDLIPGTSGIVVHGDAIPSLPLPFPAGVSQTLTIGKARGGKVRAAVKAANVHYPPIPVGDPAIACTCLRGVAIKTCGGTLFNVDGSSAANCTPDYTAGDSVCAGSKPCAFVYGPDNAAEGVVGCESLAGVNIMVEQDSGGVSDPPGPPVVTVSGTGGPGSAVLYNATGLGFVLDRCEGSGAAYGGDGMFCTDDDSQASRGMITPGILVTGTASGRITRANGTEDITVPFEGVIEAHGAPLSCDGLANGNVSGSALAGIFTMLDAETIMDIVVTNVQIAQ